MLEEVSRQPRIAIVGAGAAGLAAAQYLKDRGYHDVLVLEKLRRVGGLCETITDGYKSFDLGGNYITWSYRETKRLARMVKAETYVGKSYTVGRPVDRDGRKEMEYASVLEFVRRNPDGSRVPVWKLALGVVKFAWLRRRVRHLVDHPTYAHLPGEDGEGEDLCVSFEAWLDANGLGFMKRMFLIPMPMMGYGLLHEIAAPYALKYMAPGTFWSMVLAGLPGLRRIFAPKRFKLGFARMWESLSWGLNVRLGVKILKITRTDSPVRPIEIEVRYPDRAFFGEKDVSETLCFDRLILACPLTLPVLDGELHLDLTAEERGLFGEVETYSYCQSTFHAVTGEGGNESPFALVDPVVPVVPFDESTIGMPWVVVQVWEEASRLIQFYSRVDLPDPAAKEEVIKAVVVNNVARVLEHMGAHVAGTTYPDAEGRKKFARWHTFNRWPYFGHVTPEHFLKGWFRDLESIQGRHGTYYTGGATTFELVEAVVRSARHAVEKLDEELRATWDPQQWGPEPTPPPRRSWRHPLRRAV